MEFLFSQTFLLKQGKVLKHCVDKAYSLKRGEVFMKKNNWHLFAILGIFVLAACTDGPNTITRPDAEAYVTVTHRSGTTDVPFNPQNIAVFDMAILDSLATLGLSERVIGMPQNAIVYLVSEFQDADVANFGTLHDPNMEMMARYDIDLIIISGRARPYFDELSELAPTIDLGLDIADMAGSFLSNHRALGEIFGIEEAVEANLSDILALFDEATALSAQLEDEKALIIMYNDGDFQAFGPGGRFGIIHDVFGVPYVDGGVGLNAEGNHVNHGMTVNNEYIYAVDPAIIFVIDRNYTLSGSDPALHQSGFGNAIIDLTTAGRNRHIFDLNPEVYYIAPGGLQSMRGQVQGVIDALRIVLGQ